MRILVACEESQAVTIELRRLGHEAYSCDIQDCSGGHPEWHIKGDALKIINPEWYDGRYGWVPHIEFETVDGEWHQFDAKWDMIIAHPPCQKLSNAGAVNLGRKQGVCATQEWKDKFFADRQKAAEFFLSFINADCEKICVENPDGYMNTHYKKPTQHIEPYMFGHPWKKKTGLWLKGLPQLVPTEIVEPTGKWVQQNKMGRPAKSEAWKVVGHRDAKIRSKTFPGIARAMAEQWAGICELDTPGAVQP